MKSSITSGALLTAVTLVLAAAPLAGSTEIIEQILVKVNGEIITKTELEQRQIAALRESKIDPSVLRNEEELKQALAKVTPRILVTTIDEMLLMQRAKELGMSVTDTQFAEVLDSIKRDNKIESDAAFEAALKTEGLTIASLRTILTNNLADAIRKFRQAARRDVSREVPLQQDSGQGPGSALPADTPSPSWQAMEHEQLLRLKEALGRLPERYQQIIRLRNQERCSFAEIGQEMRCSADAARMLWARAIEHLHQELEPEA